MKAFLSSGPRGIGPGWLIVTGTCKSHLARHLTTANDAYRWLQLTSKCAGMDDEAQQCTQVIVEKQFPLVAGICESLRPDVVEQLIRELQVGYGKLYSKAMK